MKSTLVPVCLFTLLVIHKAFGDPCGQELATQCQNTCQPNTPNCDQTVVQNGNNLKQNSVCQCTDATGNVVGRFVSSSSKSSSTGGNDKASNCGPANMQMCTAQCQSAGPNVQTFCYEENQTTDGSQSSSYDCQCRSSDGSTVSQSASTTSNGSRKKRTAK